MLLRGSKPLRPKGGDCATHAPFAQLCLRPCTCRDSAFSADCFPDATAISIECKFVSRKQYQTEHRQGELHEQWHLCEQQRADCSETGELLRAAEGSHRAVSRWKLQLQHQPTRYVFAPRRRRQMALSPKSSMILLQWPAREGENDDPQSACYLPVS